LKGFSVPLKRSGHFGNIIASQIALPTFLNTSSTSFALQYDREFSQASVVTILSLFYLKELTPISICLALLCSFMLNACNYSANFTSFSIYPYLNSAFNSLMVD